MPVILTLLAPDGVPCCLGTYASIEEARYTAQLWIEKWGYGYSIGGYEFGHFKEIEKVEPWVEYEMHALD